VVEDEPVYFGTGLIRFRLEQLKGFFVGRRVQYFGGRLHGGSGAHDEACSGGYDGNERESEESTEEGALFEYGLGL